MNRLIKYVATVLALCFAAFAALHAQEKDQPYYNTHSSEILPDAQAAFAAGRYERAVELCGWYYVWWGDTKADALRKKAEQCAKLTAEISGLLAAKEVTQAQSKAESVLALNPDDEWAKDVIAQIWVDLGLPSGKWWKKANETGFYKYDEAVSRYGDRLPGRDDFEELIKYCQWTWTDKGYRVTGPSGESIDLPAEGLAESGGTVRNVGFFGRYWSSSPVKTDGGWYLNFNSSGLGTGIGPRGNEYSVRLVRTK